MAGGYTSVFRGSGVEFDDVREYVEGDDPRAVDWNVTARIGRPYVKKYVDERELTVLFLLDLSASMTGGFGIWSARQTAVRICACLALSAVRNNDKVGLIAFSDGVDRYVPAKKGLAPRAADRARLPRAPRERACRPTSRRRSSSRRAVVRRRSVLFVLSDFLDARLAATRSRSARAGTTSSPCACSSPELARARRAASCACAIPRRGRETRRRLEQPARARRLRGARRALARRDGRGPPPRQRRRHGRARPARRRIPTRSSRPILDFFRMRELRGAKR